VLRCARQRMRAPSIDDSMNSASASASAGRTPSRRRPSAISAAQSAKISSQTRRIRPELAATSITVLSTGVPEAGKGNGQRLVTYETRVGGRIEMEVLFGTTPTRYGGPIVIFDPDRELAFESDWIPNRGWTNPTRITLRLTPALGGTLVELFHQRLRIHRRKRGRGARRLRDGMGDDAVECAEKGGRRIG
jgi:hypothetical protein